MKTIALICALLILSVSAYADEQSQQAEQNQGQQQGIAGNFGITKSFNSEGIRFFPVAVDPYNPTLAPHFGGPNYKDLGPNFTSIKAILAISEYWDVKKATGRELHDWGDDSFDGMKVSCEPIDEVPRARNRRTYKTIRAVMQKPAGELEGYAVCTIRATADDKTSMSVFKEAIRQVQGLGANLMHVIAEGGSKELEAWGIGVGIGYVSADMSNNGRNSGIGSGGTGVNFAETYYETLPWLQFVAYHEKK